MQLNWLKYITKCDLRDNFYELMPTKMRVKSVKYDIVWLLCVSVGRHSTRQLWKVHTAVFSSILFSFGQTFLGHCTFSFRPEAFGPKRFGPNLLKKRRLGQRHFRQIFFFPFFSLPYNLSRNLFWSIQMSLDCKFGPNVIG